MIILKLGVDPSKFLLELKLSVPSWSNGKVIDSVYLEVFSVRIEYFPLEQFSSFFRNRTRNHHQDDQQDLVFLSSVFHMNRKYWINKWVQYFEDTARHWSSVEMINRISVSVSSLSQGVKVASRIVWADVAIFSISSWLEDWLFVDTEQCDGISYWKKSTFGTRRSKYISQRYTISMILSSGSALYSKLGCPGR